EADPEAALAAGYLVLDGADGGGDRLVETVEPGPVVRLFRRRQKSGHRGLDHPDVGVEPSCAPVAHRTLHGRRPFVVADDPRVVLVPAAHRRCQPRTATDTAPPCVSIR